MSLCTKLDLHKSQDRGPHDRVQACEAGLLLQPTDYKSTRTKLMHWLETLWLGSSGMIRSKNLWNRYIVVVCVKEGRRERDGWDRQV